ncbi:MAG: MBL fold metallo-hydrolase [Syntrophomonas sp.]
MYHTIIPVFNGYFSIDFGSMLNTHASYWPFNSRIEKSPSFVFLIIDEQGGAVLVDTGFSKDYIFGFPPFSSCQREKKDELPASLYLQGFRPDDIKQIIMTHIHWDHTGGMEYFPNSTFYVQAEDFRALFRLQPNEETGYCPSHWIPHLSRVQLVEGNTDVKPGIKLVLSGGHTAGHQMVEVATRAGKVLLGGDLRFDYSVMWQVPQKNWDLLRNGAGQKMFWNRGVLIDIKNWLESRQAWISPLVTDPKPDIESDYFQVLYSHDPGLLSINSIP